MRYRITCLLILLFSLQSNAQGFEQNSKPVSYKGFIELGGGVAYNLNTAQLISNLNMQMLWNVSTSHGIKYKGIFGGLGVGFNHTQTDKENMYLTYADLRYTFEKYKIKPSIGLKGGMIIDPYWIEPVQCYGALSCHISVYKNFLLAIEGSIFSRPSRHFTANALIIASYTFGNNR